MSRIEYFENLYAFSMNYIKCIRNFENTKSFIISCDAIMFLGTTVMVFFPIFVVVNSLYFELLLLS